jgi:IS30 family transposase
MSYKHISSHERYVIYHLLLWGLSYREIGRRLNRHHTTISREANRNGRVFACYWNEFAQQQADERKSKARHYRKQTNKRLYRYVLHRLKKQWSPDIIAGRMRQDYPDDPAMRISQEGIYGFIYRDALAGGMLYSFLHRGRKKRRKQRKYGSLRGLIPNRVGIAERPEIVDTRKRIGDWEGDTLEGCKGSEHIATHVERKSRYLIASKLSDKSASVMADKTIKCFQKIPKLFRKTLTVDNGKEFAKFGRIEAKTGLDIYFSDPYSPWQRGTNENTNGMLRKYFPKGSNFKQISDEQLASIVKKLNNRPRKCLNYLTPHEVFFGSLSGALTT